MMHLLVDYEKYYPKGKKETPKGEEKQTNSKGMPHLLLIFFSRSASVLNANFFSRYQCYNSYRNSIYEFDISS